MNSKTRLLRTLPGLSDTPRAVIDILSTRCDVLVVADGDRVCTAGGRASHCLVVAAGEVRPSTAARFFDLDGLIVQESWHVFPTTLVAVGEVTLLVIDSRDVPVVAASLATNTMEPTTLPRREREGDQVIEFRT